jgi:hypothetical protein
VASGTLCAVLEAPAVVASLDDVAEVRRWLDNYQKLKHDPRRFANSIMICCVQSRVEGAREDGVLFPG